MHIVFCLLMFLRGNFVKVAYRIFSIINLRSKRFDIQLSFFPLPFKLNCY